MAGTVCPRNGGAAFNRPSKCDCVVLSTAVAVLVGGYAAFRWYSWIKATETVATHDRPGGARERDWRSALRYAGGRDRGGVVLGCMH
jgi:hypothetical protein